MARQFTDRDVQPWAGQKGLFADWQTELIDAPLDWQKQGLQQTATGYGNKLTTRHKINFNGKEYRLYATCYSNAASIWFTVKGQRIYVN